jgi:hypothetical protein
MREVVTGIASLAMFAATLAVAGAVATQSYATMAPPSNGCYWSKHKHYCPGSRVEPSTSTELFPSRCNGELGFWEEPVVFQNGETLCIARSTADFYHNGGLVPTCTVKYWHDGHKVTTTSDGACPPKHTYTVN